MNVAIYLAKTLDGSTKAREEALGTALKRGFEKHGDKVHLLPAHEFQAPLEGVQLAAVIGVKGHSKRIFEAHRRAGRHALFIDKSYFWRGEYHRLSLDGFQPHYAHAVKRPADRLSRLGLKFLPRKTGPADWVIYAGSSQKYCDWHGLGDVNDFAQSWCMRINKIFGTGNELPSTMPLLYRPKPSWVANHPDEVRTISGTKFSGPEVRLSELLPRCHALVTHGSNAAVEAILAGIPAVVISRGACAAEPVAELDDQMLVKPSFPSDDERRQWAANLAYCQFTLEEMASGFAWETLHPHTIKVREKDIENMDEMQGVIELYKIMHESPKMFRGKLADVYATELSELCRVHGAHSLLDYGCGKGHQYSVHKQHKQFGFPEPKCYDPGYAPFAEKPKDAFDGVLCLDVMEHIPEGYVDEVLGEIFGYCRKFAYFVIFTELARKSLPDGRNAHLTVRPESWWRERLEKQAGGKPYVAHFKGKD